VAFLSCLAVPFQELQSLPVDELVSKLRIQFGIDVAYTLLTATTALDDTGFLDRVTVDFVLGAVRLVIVPVKQPHFYLPIFSVRTEQATHPQDPQKLSGRRAGTFVSSTHVAQSHHFHDICKLGTHPSLCDPDNA
jgi:hypothetical protein